MSVIRVFAVLSIFATLSNALDQRSQTAGIRIVGGYRPPEHTLAKHIVSLNLWGKANTHFCGGTIIAPDKIMTAAHCVTFQSPLTGDIVQPHEMQIIAGSPFRNRSHPKAQVIDVVKFSIHEQFGKKFFLFLRNDVAILHLEKKIIEDGVTAQSIPIASKRPADRTKCTAIGWGRIFWDGPQAAEVTYVDLDITPRRICRKRGTVWLLKLFNVYNLSFTKSVLCVSDLSDDLSAKNGCKGDSGGPLFCNGTVAGIAGFVVGGCEFGISGYTSTASFYPWIQDQIVKS